MDAAAIAKAQTQLCYIGKDNTHANRRDYIMEYGSCLLRFQSHWREDVVKEALIVVYRRVGKRSEPGRAAQQEAS